MLRSVPCLKPRYNAESIIEKTMILVDTITAISTAPGTGAIAIVRLSGNNSWSIAEKIFSPRKNASEKSTTWSSGQALFGYAKDIRSEDIVDEIVLIPYKGPHTYTGEDLVEINCHGGAVVTREILNLCIAAGATVARAGEFTERAFLNGRMDLVQAEAVHDLISAKTSKQSRLAVSALKGELGRSIHDARATLIELLTRVNAGIDFPEEVGEVPLDDVSSSVQAVKAKLQRLAATTRSGKFLREGLKLAIVGKPNAGKSSLLNQLLNFERAIVTDIPGTTRDSLEEILDLNGIPVIITDTAGIRETQDRVEQIGIERSRAAADASDLILLMCDLSTDWTATDTLIIEMIGHKPYLVLGNKVDLHPGMSLEAPTDIESKNWALYDIASTAGSNNSATHIGHGAAVTTMPRLPDLLADTTQALARIPISAKTGENIDKLSNWIETWALSELDLKETGGSLNVRQGALCLKSITALDLVAETLKNDMPQDCLATDLKSAIDNLSEVCGEVVSDEVIANVFATFCIGK
jgi:tRNA modification GTPase